MTLNEMIEGVFGIKPLENQPHPSTYSVDVRERIDLKTIKQTDNYVLFASLKQVHECDLYHLELLSQYLDAKNPWELRRILNLTLTPAALKSLAQTITL